MTRRRIFLLVAAFGFWSTAYNLVLNWLPPAALGRGAAPGAVGTLMAAGYLGAAFLGLPPAWMADRLGQRRTLFGMWAVSALGCLLLALGGPWLLMLAAAALALASLGALPVLTALAARTTPGGTERQTFGWVYAGGPIGLIIASLAGGLVADRWSAVAPLWAALLAQCAAALIVLALPAAETPVTPRPPQMRTARAAESVPLGGWLSRHWREGLLLSAALAGYACLCLPNTFTLIFARDYLGLRFLTGGLFFAGLGAAQLGWSLWLSRWPPPGRVLRLKGDAGVASGAVLAIVLVLLANGAGGVVTALVAQGWALALGLVLRGSLYALQPLSATVISAGERRGKSAPLTALGVAVGVATGAASAGGGVLYAIHPTAPFAVAGGVGLGGAAILLIALQTLRALAELQQRSA